MSPREQSGCLGFVFNLFPGLVRPDGDSTSERMPLPYRRKDFLLSKAERSFFGVLEQAVGTDYWLFPKIRVADLLWLPKIAQSRQSHFNRIAAKHIDFVLCDCDTVRPMLAIELDDGSHQREKRIRRDAFVDEALKAAGLPLLRVPAQHAYNVAELKAKIDTAIRASTM
jgi:very-short-patch-repair endonuclease